ncbi:hypothetical protein [Streptomyces sp. NPDC054854]
MRRTAVICLAAAAVLTGGAASSALAAPAIAAAAPAADGPFGGHGHGDRPIRFGPFELPSNGNVSAGFAWNTSNGGGVGF